MSDGEGPWVVIPNWGRFQHYSDRDPTWIKDYVSQLEDDDWLKLTSAARGVLTTARLMYAASDGKLTLRRLKAALKSGNRRLEVNLASLNDAGLIRFSASKPLALARSREKRSEEKTDRASAQPPNPGPSTAPNDPERLPIGDVLAGLAESSEFLTGWLNEHNGDETAGETVTEAQGRLEDEPGYF